jgi:uncharacterized protein (DUF1501 family)
VISTSALAGFGGVSSVVSSLAAPDSGLGWLATPVNPHERILVVLRLFGGNDGLNTLVPVHDDEYYRLRRDIAMVDLSIPAEQTLGVRGYDHVRFHPAMKGLAQLFDEKKVAIVQGVGYPNMDLSHFRGTNIWLSASDSDVFRTDGWMGRFLEQRLAAGTLELNAPYAIEMGPQLGRAFTGERLPMGFAFTETSFIPDEVGPVDPTSAAADLEELLTSFRSRGEHHIRSITQALSTHPADPREYYVGDGNMGPALQNIARCIRGGLPTPMYIVHTGQFDTHHFQPSIHHQQLDELSTNVLAFQRELERARVEDRVTLLIISEFGRRPETNNSGTDHGTAGPVFLVGTSVMPGLHGVTPTVSDLDVDGNLHWHVDFRSIYASILEQWFESDPTSYVPTVLTRPFPTMSLFRPAHRNPTTNPSGDGQPLVWPNPCTSELNIAISSEREVLARVTITDLSGRMMRVQDVMFRHGIMSIDVRSVSSGSYLAHITAGPGTFSVPFRVLR